MQLLILIFIVVATTFEFLKAIGVLPRFAPFMYEMLSMVAMVYVLAVGIRTRFQYVRPAYWFVFGMVIVTMACGAVLNSLDAGPLFAGIRNYFSAIPLFFLAAMYSFTDDQLRTQFKLVLLVCAVQVPVALYQRFTTLGKGELTGDLTSGTLGSSGILSLFLIAMVPVITTALLKKRLGLFPFLLLFLIMVIPTTVNETKVSIVLVPLALLLTFLTLSKRGTRLKNTVLVVVLVIGFGAIFVPIYNHFMSFREYPTPIAGYFEKDRFEGYMSKDLQVGVVNKDPGRIDQIKVPVVELAKEPVFLIFGRGMGNASHSALGEQFTGKYYRLFKPFLQNAFSRIVMELGMLGVALVFMLYWMIFSDSRIVARKGTGLKGVLGSAWLVVMVIIVIATFYSDIVTVQSISGLFWFYSGVIAAERMRIMSAENAALARATAREVSAGNSRLSSVAS